MSCFDKTFSTHMDESSFALSKYDLDINPVAFATEKWSDWHMISGAGVACVEATMREARGSYHCLDGVINLQIEEATSRWASRSADSLLVDITDLAKARFSDDFDKARLALRRYSEQLAPDVELEIPDDAEFATLVCTSDDAEFDNTMKLLRSLTFEKTSVSSLVFWSKLMKDTYDGLGGMAQLSDEFGSYIRNDLARRERRENRGPGEPGMYWDSEASALYVEEMRELSSFHYGIFDDDMFDELDVRARPRDVMYVRERAKARAAAISSVSSNHGSVSSHEVSM